MKAISEWRCDMIWLLHVKQENGSGDWWDMHASEDRGGRGEADAVEMKGSWVLDIVEGGASRVSP